MSHHLAFGILLAATLTTLPSTQLLTPAEDPCLLAKRIAQSQPCLAGAPCPSEELWRIAFGTPRLRPAGFGALPPDLMARLPKVEVTLGRFNGMEETFQRLGEASGVEVLVDPEVRGERLSGALGTLPLERAWRHLLSAAGLTARLDGDKVVLSKTDPGQQEAPRRSAASTANCTAR